MSALETVASRFGALRLALGLIAAVATLIAIAPAAHAHTDLDFTDPEDGATPTAEVDELSLTFTLPVTTLGEGVEVVGPEGAVAVQVSQRDDGAVVIATPSSPLTSGSYDVEWTVAAQDGHPLTGQYSFVVDVPAASPAPESPSAAASPAVEASPTSPASPATTQVSAAEDPSEQSTAIGTTLARLGNAAVLWGLLVAGGGLAFAAWALRGPDRVDVPRVLTLVRVSGMIALVGVGVRVAGRSLLLAQGEVDEATSLDGVADALAGTTAWVLGLEAVGAIMVALGAWRSLGASSAAIVGVLVVGAGQVLGGHSGTAEPRWVVLIADVSHLAAGAVWVGGIVALLTVMRARRRAGRDPHARPMAARFGTMAAASLVVFGVAGVALAVAIMDDLTQLWSTVWGVTLMVKVVLVAIVAAVGAHQHFRVVPSLPLEPGRHDPARTDAIMVRAARTEAILMTAVIGVTAWLVASSLHA